MDFDEIDLKTIEDLKQYIEINKKNKIFKKIIDIRKGYSIQQLRLINEFLLENQECIIFIMIDVNDKKEDGKIWFLDIIKYLPNILHLSIFSSGSEELITINEVSVFKNLKSFKLIGFYKKTISLKPIENFKELEELELNWGLNKVQQIIVNDFKKLKKLNVRTIDLTSFDIKKDIEELRVDYSVRAHQKLKDVFPNLKYLLLNKCREIEDFSFLDNLSSLEELSLNYMPQLVEFPNLPNHKKLKKLELLEARNLNYIKNILNFSTLEKLAITRIKGLKAKDFEVFSNLKHLNTLYADFEDNNERKKFEELAQKNNWKNTMIGF